MTRNAIHWFEIPVADIDRAQRFYETLLAQDLRREQMGPQTLAMFGYDGRHRRRADPERDRAEPRTEGTLVYLNAEPSLDAVLSRAAELGAKVLQPKLELPRTSASSRRSSTAKATASACTRGRRT